MARHPAVAVAVHAMRPMRDRVSGGGDRCEAAAMTGPCELRMRPSEEGAAPGTEHALPPEPQMARSCAGRLSLAGEGVFPWAAPAGAGDTRDLQRCVVIGCSGMLGFEIVRQLVAAGKQVRILDLQPPPEPVCEARPGDIRSWDDVLSACTGVDVVFQTAAAVWDVNTPAHVYQEVNVDGNRLVVEACRRLGI